MSRSGYVDEPEFLELWRASVERAIKGKRGQALLRELADALDAMKDKRLYAMKFATADGEYCALGVLAAKRGVKVDDLGDGDDCDPSEVGRRFDIARAMAAEIMYVNDGSVSDYYRREVLEICGPVRPWQSHSFYRFVKDDDHPKKRWQRVREWVRDNQRSIGE